MNFHLFDLAGFIGVLLIVVAYLLLQLDKLPSSSPRYSLLNAGRSTADNRFAHLRLQFVSVYRGGVLVFDQLARFMAIAHFPERFETWRSAGINEMATSESDVPLECASG